VNFESLSERGAVRTAELTKAFGWDRDEVFVQHDVQVGTDCFTSLVDEFH
jgi:hypothetical protein